MGYAIVNGFLAGCTAYLLVEALWPWDFRGRTKKRERRRT